MSRKEKTSTRLVLVSLLLLSVGCSEERRITTQSDEALAVYRVGVSQLERFYFAEAQQDFDEALRLDSNFAMAWARHATLAEAIQNRSKAISEIDRAMTLLDNVSPYEQMFVRLQSYRIKFSTRQAEELSDSMVRLYPEEKEVHLIRGNLFDQSKKFDESIRCYKRAIEVDTSYALAVMYLGYAYSTIGEQEKAVAQMERYIRMAPDAADPRASFADILQRVGRYDEAMDQYRKSLELKPDYWYSVNQIGGIYMLQGKLAAAENQFHKGLALLPKSNQLEATHLALDGTLNLLRGHYQAATSKFHEALQLDSTNGDAAFGLVNAFRKQEQFKQGHQMLQRIRDEMESRHTPESQYMLRYHLSRSRLLLDEGNYAEARAICDSALEFTTILSRGPVFQLIAEINVREKQYEEAFDACEEALRINPNYPDALMTLVKAYHGNGDIAMTREISGRLLEFWKDADPDFLMLQTLRQLLGKGKTPAASSATTVSIAAASN